MSHGWEEWPTICIILQLFSLSNGVILISAILLPTTGAHLWLRA